MSALATLSRTPLARALLVAALVLLLQVPSCAIGGLAHERRQSRDTAAGEIAATWGRRQDVQGPFLVVPYRIVEVDANGHRFTQDSGHVVVLPDRLDMHADLAVEARRRGLFEVPVYRTTLRITGRFAPPRTTAGALVPETALRWREAQLVVGIADVHAIDRAAPLGGSGAERPFQPGAGSLGPAGIHVALGELAPETPREFAIELTLRGSEGLRLAALGRETAATMRSAWPHPSFGGTWLPTERSVGRDGFTARWQVTHLARGLPGAWKNRQVDADALAATRFGVDLLQPIDPYRMSERSLKYDVLFVGLTFLVIWGFELVARRTVPLLQYLLLGSALCLFYLLELSLAEHLGFAAAYALAATAVTLQVSLYARAALRGTRPALALGGVVAALYGLLYVLLREEEAALLIGSGFLFAVLSVVMFLTRRLPDNNPSAEAAVRP